MRRITGEKEGERVRGNRGKKVKKTDRHLTKLYSFKLFLQIVYSKTSIKFVICLQNFFVVFGMFDSNYTCHLKTGCELSTER